MIVISNWARAKKNLVVRPRYDSWRLFETRCSLLDQEWKSKASSGHDSKVEAGQFSQVIDYKTACKNVTGSRGCRESIPSRQ